MNLKSRKKHHFKSKLVDIFLPKSYEAITLWGHVFYRETREDTPAFLINHETIHLMQMHLDGKIKFYFKYALDYLKLRKKGYTHSMAYYRIPYEREAYNNQSDPTYVDRIVAKPSLRKLEKV